MDRSETRPDSMGAWDTFECTDTPAAPPTKEASPLPALLHGALLARMERLLQDPVWCTIPGTGGPTAADQHTANEADGDIEDEGIFGAFLRAAAGPDALAARRERHSPGFESLGDGTLRIPLAFDTDDLWREREKDLLDQLRASEDELVWLLTDAQHALLLQSPMELLTLHPPPCQGRLVEVRTEHRGGRELPVDAIVEHDGEGLRGVRHFALVPNLTPLRRMKDALELLRRADCPPALAPLRALLGLQAAPPVSRPSAPDRRRTSDRLDAHQRAAVQSVLETPHFALVQGPPGSGKTTVIRTIIQRELSSGHRVLVVSPTHVAVDNVVEKLWPDPTATDDELAPHTLPVRWASRPGKLSNHARKAWVSNDKNPRAANIAVRLETCLRRTPALERIWSRVDPKLPSRAPLSAAACAPKNVICGTPIGILSCPELREAAPGSFDLLIVDEVSKLTLPEFLAVAVYARRWALIGDPEQLPPYLDPDETAACLTPTYSVLGELAASVSALVESAPPRAKDELRAVVVAADPEATRQAIQTQLQRADVRARLPVHTLESLRKRHAPGILVCRPEDHAEACAAAAPRRLHATRHGRHHRGSVALLVQDGLTVPRPEVASGVRLVESRDRAPARMVGLCHDLLHSLPWARTAKVRPPALGRRKGLPKLLPQLETGEDLDRQHEELARLYALLGISVYDWLNGLPAADWPAGPLDLLGTVMAPVAPLQNAVAPWSSTLRKQYRMLPALSAVPRALFYDGKALQDGRKGRKRGMLHCVQVSPQQRVRESNPDEAQRILSNLEKIDQQLIMKGHSTTHEVLIITPYREQERLLNDHLDELQRQRPLQLVRPEVCTLDRCQGREAATVIISLVRSRASAFLDNPKRWNVALTRARDSLLIYGDIDAYIDAVREPHSPRGPKQSVITTFLRAMRDRR